MILACAIAAAVRGTIRPQALRSATQEATAHLSNRRLLPVALVVVGFLCLAQRAASTVFAQPAAPRAATVDGRAVSVAEVEYVLRTALGQRKLAADALRFAQAQALEQALDERLVYAALAADGWGAADDEQTQLVAELVQELERQGRAYADYLAELGLSEEEHRRVLAWRFAWSRYLADYLTDERLQAEFAARPRQYDGTQLRVSHILLPVEKPRTPATEARALQAAAELRTAILAKEVSFADAARRRSVGPSGQQGGDLGVIARDGPMSEAFLAAAFSLAEGELSPPVLSPFGVHLILCTQVLPGTRTWRDAQGDLERAAARSRFAELAAARRPQAKIEYAGDWPHFRPGTQELAE